MTQLEHELMQLVGFILEKHFNGEYKVNVLEMDNWIATSKNKQLITFINEETSEVIFRTRMVEVKENETPSDTTEPLRS